MDDRNAENAPVAESLSDNIDPIMDAGVRSVEATLFASENPMTIADIKLYVGEDVDIQQALADLQADYQHRGIVLIKSGDRWHFQTAQEFFANPPWEMDVFALSALSQHRFGCVFDVLQEGQSKPFRNTILLALYLRHHDYQFR